MGKQVLLPHFFMQVAKITSGEKSKKRGIALLFDNVDTCNNMSTRLGFVSFLKISTGEEECPKRGAISMDMRMAKVKGCDAEECAYNIKNKCHAIAITVGGKSIPKCDTLVIAAKQGGLLNMTAGVGACKVENCQFNKSFMCIAKSIRVKVNTLLPECVTFKER